MEGSKPKNSKKNRKIIISIVVIILIAGGIIGYKINKENQYKKEIIDTSSQMISLAADCEKVINNYTKLWGGKIESSSSWTRGYIAQSIGIDPNNFIANTSPLKFDDKALSFNDVLGCYMEYNNNTGINSELNDRMKTIDDEMKELNNPNDKYRSAYDSLLKMYQSLSSFEKDAISPNGSLNSYKNEINKLDNEIVSNYNVFKTQLPN